MLIGSRIVKDVSIHRVTVEHFKRMLRDHVPAVGKSRRIWLGEYDDAKLSRLEAKFGVTPEMIIRDYLRDAENPLVCGALGLEPPQEAAE